MRLGRPTSSICDCQYLYNPSFPLRYNQVSPSKFLIREYFNKKFPSCPTFERQMLLLLLGTCLLIDT